MNKIKEIDQKVLKNLFFIRHGESTCNTFNRLAGKFDVPLTTLGVKQAKECSKKCKHLIFDKIFVSPLKRAFNTAEIIFENHPNTNKNFIIDDRLKERDFGNFSLENKSILQKKYGITEYEKAVNRDSEKMQEGESYLEFSNRVLAFFYDLIVPLLNKNKKVIIVAHKYVIELLCNLVLNKPINKKFDLRLPNAQVLEASKITKYVKHENEKVNIFKEWLIVNHHWVFLISFLFGFILNYFKVTIETDSLTLLGILILATTITMARINIESSIKMFKTKDVFLFLLRYLLLPLIFIFYFYIFEIEPNNIMAIFLLFLSTPVAMIAITISRSIGGFIVPSLSFTIFSSLLSIIPFTLTLNLLFDDDIALISFISFIIVIASLLIPYFFVYFARKHKAIKTAKNAERGGYLAIILISIFIILVTLKLENISIESFVLVSLMAIVLRIIASIFSSKNRINSLDTYISMSYPNVFLMIIIGNLMEHTFIIEISIIFLIPMFLLSIFDNWYSKRFYTKVNDKRLFNILNIKS